MIGLEVIGADEGAVVGLDVEALGMEVGVASGFAVLGIEKINTD
jgi:hypothetical protein